MTTTLIFLSSSRVLNLKLALEKQCSLLNLITKVREAVLGRGDSGSLVADIVLPTSREVARIERVSFYLENVSFCLENLSLYYRHTGVELEQLSQVRRTWSERDFSGEVEARLRAWVARHKKELPVYAL